MAHASVILPIGVVAVAILIAVLSDGVKDDVKAILLMAMENAVRSNAITFLPPAEAQHFICWFEGDLEEVRQRGGSGISIAILFLVYTGPYYTWRLLHDQRARRR